MNTYLVRVDLSHKDGFYIWTSISDKCKLDFIVGSNNKGVRVEANSPDEAIEALCKTPSKFAPTYKGGAHLRTDIWAAVLIGEDNAVATTIMGVDKGVGMFCLRCTEFAFMAESNMPDGKFKCFSCRKYAYR